MTKEIIVKETIGDVWSFETGTEEIACDIVNNLYLQGLKRGGTKERNILKDCFGDDWQTIKERFETEGSVWYVWYMDGVRKFIFDYLK